MRLRAFTGADDSSQWNVPISAVFAHGLIPTLRLSNNRPIDAEMYFILSEATSGTSATSRRRTVRDP